MVRLRRVTPYAGGYHRTPSGRILRADRAPMGADERERVRALAVPPAWSDVWIADRPNAHILAVGVDDAGRRQYLYHPDWRAAKDREKFARMRELAAALPAARGSVTRDLRLDGLPRERVLAAVFRLLDLGALRVGSEEYLEANGSRGATTLQVRHATVSGASVALSFRSKGGQRARMEVDDAELAACVGDLVDAARTARLFAWRDEGGRHLVSAVDVNRYIRSRTGTDATAKDFRTLRGTVAAAQALAAASAPGTPDSARARQRARGAAIEAASVVLGNTPAIAKASYVDPEIFDRFDAGAVLEPNGSPDAALLRLLEG